jgi:hypothetical protein
MAKVTKEQQKALLNVYRRDSTVATSYLAFRRTAAISFGSLMVFWKNMWLGIEENGYTHS